MALTALMLVVLIVGYLLMLGLVKFSESVIERPRSGKRGRTAGRANNRTPIGAISSRAQSQPR